MANSSALGGASSTTPVILQPAVALRRLAQSLDEAIADAAEYDILGHPHRALQHAAHRRHGGAREIGVALHDVLIGLAAHDDDFTVLLDLEHRARVERQRVAGVEREERQFLAVDRGEASQAAAADDHESVLGRLFFIGAIDQLTGPDAADLDEGRQRAGENPLQNLRQRQRVRLAVASAAACADDQPRVTLGERRMRA